MTYSVISAQCSGGVPPLALGAHLLRARQLDIVFAHIGNVLVNNKMSRKY